MEQNLWDGQLGGGGSYDPPDPPPPGYGPGQGLWAVHGGCPLHVPPTPDLGLDCQTRTLVVSRLVAERVDYSLSPPSQLDILENSWTMSL